VKNFTSPDLQYPKIIEHWGLLLLVLSTWRKRFLHN